MPKFILKATDKKGEIVTKTLEAESIDEVVQISNIQGLIPIYIKTKKEIGFDFLNTIFFRFSKTDLILFTTQLATMLKAGLPITRALRAIAAQQENKKFALALEDIRSSVEKGRTFYNSLSMYPQFFDEVYIAIVRIGEVSGNLPEILFKLSEHIEKDEEVRQKIKNATLYPKIVVGAIITAILILITFVIPKFAQLYKSFRTELPLPTKMLIAISDFFINNWYVIIIFGLFMFFLYFYLTKTQSGKRLLHPLLLKLPVFGMLIRKMVMVRFSRFFSLLFSSGIVITTILDLLKNTIDNVVFVEKLSIIKENIVTGASLLQSVEKTGFFTPLVQEMIAVGEETGSLDEMLKKVADFYENDLDFTINRLTTLLEPAMLVVIFGMVLFLALSVFLPMWDMVKFVKG
jgi:MSHA biogenesis protein MshG